ncbi:hypothetical protein NQ317_003402 [Molorchus minor]|uniref:Uncharacterized protein n=1 Tax=Molorchus minor TaxID=1323400 RepID=A0ABQ9IVW3_9CUCU|nr:hypothetical protein NQ317_003402 [Molorchus minor]
MELTNTFRISCVLPPMVKNLHFKKLLRYCINLLQTKDFSGYKAATGFNAIQLYAGNLLSQPWRKEYRQIKASEKKYLHSLIIDNMIANKLHILFLSFNY